MPSWEKTLRCLSQMSSSLLGVCYHLTDNELSLNKYCSLGKSITILGAILDRSLASLGINFCTSINDDFFMSNMCPDCGLSCRLVWWKLGLIEDKHRLSQCYISRSSCKQVYANFCSHSLSSSRKSIAWRPKWDLSCILLLTSNKVLLKASCLSNRLLAKSTFPWK